MKSWKEYLIVTLGAIVAFFLGRLALKVESLDERVWQLNNNVVVLQAILDTKLKRQGE